MDSLLDRLAVGHGAELKAPRQLGAGDIETPVLTARRDQELAVRERLPGVQLDLSRLYVDASCRGGDPLHVVVLVPVLRIDEPARQRLFAAQICLGQRRTAERRGGLVPDQNNTAIVTILAQGLGRDASGHSRPENDDRGGVQLKARRAASIARSIAAAGLLTDAP